MVKSFIRIHWWHAALLLFLILLAAALRLWRLDALPPGLYFDEAFNGVDAARVVSGESLPLFFVGNYGREPLYIYLQAISVALLGHTPLALRVVSALIGVITIPIIYWATLVMLQPLGETEDNSVADSQIYRWMALIAAAGVTISFWHLSLSRLGFRAILLPPISALAIAYFWRAWSKQRLSDYRWSGFWLGMSLFTYTAARLLPLVVVIFVLEEALLALYKHRHNRTLIQSKLTSRLRGLAWMAGIAFICLLPLMYVMFHNPELVVARTSGVSIFSAAQKDMPGTPPERLARNLVATFRSFYDSGDRNSRHNLPGRPVNDLLLATLFTLGLLAAFMKIKRPNIRLILIWFGVMALPVLLSIGAPHALRGVGMLPALAMLYALGAGVLINRFSSYKWIGMALLVLVVTVSGAWTVRDYFLRWSGDQGTGAAFDIRMQLAAETAAEMIDEMPENASLLITQGLYQTPQMLIALGPLPRRDLTPHETLPAEALARAHFLIADQASLSRSAFLIRRIEQQPVATWVELPMRDEGQLSAAFAEYNAPIAPIRSRFHQPGWPEIFGGDVPPGLNVQAPEIQHPLEVTFENGMQLLGYEVRPDGIASGTDDASFLLTTYWRTDPDRPRPDDFVFAHLNFANGQSQENGHLGGDSYPLNLWQPGEVVEDRRILKLPADAQPGKAYFEMGLIDTLEAGSDRTGIVDAMGVVGADRVDFGVVAIGITPPQADLSGLKNLGVLFDERIELVGWNASTDTQNPTRLQVELGWKAQDRSNTDYVAFVHLLDADGQIVSQHDRPPGAAENPTTMWLPGETTRTTFSLEIPDGADLPELSLRIGLYEPVSGRQLPVSIPNDLSIQADATYVVLKLGE